jgi:cytochrome subunit of sulfide dehydrogenase
MLPKTTAAAPTPALSYAAARLDERAQKNNAVPSFPFRRPDVRVFASILAAALATVAPALHAQGTAPDPTLGRSLAATCANCHGTGGKAAAGSAIPGLAGRSRDEIVRAMSEFREGKRQATIMHQLAKGYTPEQVDAMAAWFAAQK